MKKLIVMLSVVLFLSSYGFEISPELLETGKSALFPGWGFIKIQENKTAKAFMASEGAFAAVTLSLFLKSHQESENAVDMASYSLTKDVSSYPEFALLKMESFISSDEYNSTLLPKARELYPKSIEKQIEYVEAKSIPDSLSWEFDSIEEMRSYASGRADARRFRQFAFYSISALVVNHAASAIYTYFKASDFFKLVEFNGGFGLNKINFNFGIRF
ncbi:MAG: hypothetical protein AB7T10_03995 [bacterium]